MDLESCCEVPTMIFRLSLTLFILLASAPLLHAERIPYSPEQLALLRTVA